MPTSSTVRIVCEQSAKYWTVQQGGEVRLGSESEAQLFVCHRESETDRNCLIQHLQSSAFVEQGEDRKLKLAVSAASATLFSRLRAYSEGRGEDGLKDSVWLRAATGGIVCSNSQQELAVTINATSDTASRRCSYKLLTADPRSVLMNGSAAHVAPIEAHTQEVLPMRHCLAPVSIGATPVSPQFTNRSSAMPIALTRRIRKVCLSDLAFLDGSTSKQGHKSVPFYSSLSGSSSSSFSHSYTLEDAVSDRLPASPGYSLHSEGSETDESKVRGGDLFYSDQASFSDSDSQADEGYSGAEDNPSPFANPSQQSLHPQDDRYDHTVPSSDSQEAPLAQQRQHCNLPSVQQGADDDRSSCGHKAYGGSLFKKSGGTGLRTVRSTSALGSICCNLHGASHRAIQGHRTHGSQSALNFLSGGLHLSRSYSLPRAGEVEQALTQSAPTLGAGMPAHDVQNVACGQAWESLHGQLHGQRQGVDPSDSPLDPPHCSRGRSDNSEALAGLRLNRTSGDSSKEPLLPCILEGLPFQESEPTVGCPLAATALLSTTPQTAVAQSGIKRVFCSEMCGDAASLSYSIVSKVTPTGGPSNPSPSKRPLTHSGSWDSPLPAR